MVQHEKIPLEILYDQASRCRGCELWQGRTNLVFGVGNPNADVLIVGEAPGEQEDLRAIERLMGATIADYPRAEGFDVGEHPATLDPTRGEEERNARGGRRRRRRRSRTRASQ